MISQGNQQFFFGNSNITMIILHISALMTSTLPADDKMRSLLNDKTVAADK